MLIEHKGMYKPKGVRGCKHTQFLDVRLLNHQLFWPDAASRPCGHVTSGWMSCDEIGVFQVVIFVHLSQLRSYHTI